MSAPSHLGENTPRRCGVPFPPDTRVRSVSAEKPAGNEHHGLGRQLTAIPTVIPLDSREKSVKPPNKYFLLARRAQVTILNLLDRRVLTHIRNGEKDSIP
jgi:hypothetical protein